jgi:hypothetical protein
MGSSIASDKRDEKTKGSNRTLIASGLLTSLEEAFAEPSTDSCP